MEITQHIRFKGFYFHHTLTPSPAPEDFARHCHNMYEIIYIRQGNGTFLVEGTSYPVSSGCLLLFRPREFHCLQVKESAPYERFVVNFDEHNVLTDSALLLDLFQNRELGTHNLYSGLSTRLTEAFLRIAACESAAEPERSLMAKLILNELLVILHGECASDFSAPDQLINRIITYLDEHLVEPLRLEDLASEFFISRHYLGHMFKKHTGMTLMEYIIRKRLAMAQHLMRDGYQASIAASMSGFNDYSAFYRAYIKYIGLKPSEEILK